MHSAPACAVLRGSVSQVPLRLDSLLIGFNSNKQAAGQVIFRMRRPMYLINSSIYVEVRPVQPPRCASRSSPRLWMPPIPSPAAGLPLAAYLHSLASSPCHSDSVPSWTDQRGSVSPLGGLLAPAPAQVFGNSLVYTCGLFVF